MCHHQKSLKSSGKMRKEESERNRMSDVIKRKETMNELPRAT